MTIALVRYDAARKAIAAAHRVDEVKHIRDKAEAVRVYAKQAGDFELQNKAAEIRLFAERRAGELLADMSGTNGRRRKKASEEIAARGANLLSILRSPVKTFTSGSSESCLPWGPILPHLP